MRNLQGLKSKIADLLAARRAQQALPHVTAYLPNNHRGPDSDPSGTFATQIAPNVRVVHYDPANPPAELITAREQDASEAQVVPRTETHPTKGTS
jgi:hypothetical protein